MDLFAQLERSGYWRHVKLDFSRCRVDRGGDFMLATIMPVLRKIQSWYFCRLSELWLTGEGLLSCSPLSSGPWYLA